MKFPLRFLAAALCAGAGARAADPAPAVLGLIDRILPGHRADFVLETLPAPPGENVMEVEARDGRIVLRGDSPLSLAVAFNWYLRHEALVAVSWYADDPVTPPEQLPRPAAKVRRTTRVQDRFFFNYCTFGYTMPYWRWRDWERCIDWLALNGINLPLAQNGNESVWQHVWRDYGLSDEEIRGYFTGPGHLPWHRMVNIDRWDGPLPQSYIDGQRDLQRQILARERALGMTPVLCAFAGHVPEALRARQPAMKIGRIPPGWGGFPAADGCWFLDPLDPKFQEIQVKFLQEQAREYGTDHRYGTDPFNEITPPSWEPAYLASVARAIYGGMAQADPAAVWLQMGWTFGYQRAQWTDERLSAMIGAVPAGRMELLDYVCENRELFRETKAFYGAPFVWDYLGNFGGNTHLVGPLHKVNQRLTAVLNDATLKNFRGVGATLEGLNNPVVYEFVFDRIWGGADVDLPAWVRDEAAARAGGRDPQVAAAWDLLRAKVLVDQANTIGGHGVAFQAPHPAWHEEIGRMLHATQSYDNADLIRAWGLFLQAAPAARRQSAYQRDLVDTTRQALGNLGTAERDRMAAAYDRKDAAGFAAAAARFLSLGRDLDAFLATRTEFLLGKWIDDARSWAGSADERAYYEKNARTLITIWGGNLGDYAGRQWNGLLADYYLPRWESLIAATQSELGGGPPADRAALEKGWRAHDQAFARSAGGAYPALGQGDFFAQSQALFAKYAAPAP